MLQSHQQENYIHSENLLSTYNKLGACSFGWDVSYSFSFNGRLSFPFLPPMPCKATYVTSNITLHFTFNVTFSPNSKTLYVLFINVTFSQAQKPYMFSS